MMTFDARKADASSASGKQNALFAAITLIVVCGAFFAVLSLPHKQDPLSEAEKAALATVSLTVRLPGENAEAYYRALGRVDAGAQAELGRRISAANAGADEAGDAELAELVLSHAMGVLQAHADELAQADTRHLDHILEVAHGHLRMASARRSKWCSAAHYADLREMEFTDPAQVQQALAGVEAPMREFAFEALGTLMQAIEEARENPVTRAPLSRTDTAALRSMMTSLMTDPDVMPLLVSLQSSDDPQKALKGVNVCNAAATAAMAAKTLPQETKGRLMAEAMMQLKQTGPETLFRNVSF